MKKTYMIPATFVMRVETVQMIATSGFESTLNTDGASGGAALGRRGGNVWDDDEEE